MLITFLRLQGTRMEERLDDAINVLRSHCEPQMNLPLGMEAAGLSGHSSFVPSQAPQNQTPGTSLNQDSSASLPLDIPVKVERTSVPSASSESLFVIVKDKLLTNRVLPEKRKEPPEADTKPSSSQAVSGSAANKANGQKRQRR